MNNITLINFTELSLQEKEMILLWRNDKAVKVWMYDELDIQIEKHLSFIEKLKDSYEKLYFLVKKKDNYLGVIDFTDINNNTAKFGLYSNPKLKGIGKVLLKTICDYAFSELNIKTLHAEVFSNNIKAIKLYKKFDFLEIKKKVINNKEVTCMELKNENR